MNFVSEVNELFFFVTILGKHNHSVQSKHYLSLGNYKFQQVCRDTTTYFLEWLKKKWTINCWQGCKATGSFILCRWDCKLEDSLVVSYKVKHSVTIQSSIIPLAIYPADLKTCLHINICTYMFIVALLIITSNWKQPRYSSIDG